MPTMRELSRWIRDYGQDARHLQRLIADRFVWHQLWAAMDIIDDVDSAMDAYLDNEFPTDTGERYLRIYGAMQGLFLQQDALSDLIKAIHPAKEIRRNDVLKEIREARHASVGHPTRLERKGQLSTHGIVQNSMSKDGFDLLSYPEQDGKVFQQVPVRELIEKQRAETVRILTEVVTDLREQEEAHRAQFRDTKLVKTFDQASYAFEKIFEETRRDSMPILSRWAIGQLQKSLNDFAESLKQRGISVDTYDSIEYLYKDIAHPLAELKKFILRESSEILSDKSAVVFATALQGYFDRLRHIAGEIDEEYATGPPPIIEPERTMTPIVIITNVIGGN
jgi:hypothetical protein